MKIEIKEETRELFEPFFRLSSFIEMNPKMTRIQKKEYNLIINDCLKSFDKGKLSVNRPMANGRGILFYIFNLDLNLFRKFYDKFSNKITSNRKSVFINYVTYEFTNRAFTDEFDEEKLIIAYSKVFGDDYEQRMIEAISKVNSINCRNFKIKLEKRVLGSDVDELPDNKRRRL